MRISKEPFSLISNAQLRRQIEDHCETCPEPELFHIDVYALADKWNLSRMQVLNAFVEGLDAGIFTLEWNYHCTSCGGILNEAEKLSGAHSYDHCTGCGIDSKNTLNKNVEIFFSIHPQLYELPIDYKESYKKDAVDDVVLNRLHPWKTPTTIYGADLIQNTVFRKLFGDDALLPDQSLELENATVLFTDIKGSTQMYTDLGDAKAFNLVTDHFMTLFDIIVRNGGVPVKTIGDSVMGVFLKPLGALSSALECQVAMRQFGAQRENDEKIELKIGLHSGTVIVVTLNGRLDYFGTAVNLASRIQSLARPCEVTISERVLKQKETITLLKRYTQTVGRSYQSFNGLNGTYTVYHMQFPETE